jgi:tetratricopeptide (TPR) repeat protein
MLAGRVGIGELVEIDMLCIAAYAQRVAELMSLNGEDAGVAAAIERLRGHVDDLRWPRKIAYLQACHALRTSHLDLAKREFAKLGPISDDESDLDILKLASSLLADELSFAHSLKLCDHILELSDELEDQLRFRGIKAARYLLHGDPEQAKLELATAVALVPDDEDRTLDWETSLTLVWCLTHLGTFVQGAALSTRADALIQYWLGLDHLDAGGVTELLRMRADLYRNAKRPSDAEAAYRAVLERENSPHCRIFLAESLLVQRRAAEAAKVLRQAEPFQMDANEYEDFMFALAGVAIATADRDGLNAAGKRLRAVRGSAPYFEQRRLAYVVAVEDVLKHGASETAFGPIRRWLADPISAFNRYVMAEPNVAGIGLRVNNILEDVARRQRSRPTGRR